MEKRYRAILLTLLIVLMAPVAALAITAPHNTSSGYACTTCHNSHSTLGSTGFNNLCMTCHNPNDARAKTKPFYQSDAANPFGLVQNGYSSGVTPGKIYQSSHNWTGSDTAPQAGAQSPTTTTMTNPNVSGKLLCARCHGIHGPRSSSTNSAPFLRMLNDNDEMCRDCHRSWDNTDHMLGSHPVNINYAAAITSNANFAVTPLNANPINTTSQLNMVNGKLQCSTCHKTHYADSRSGTVDSPATYNNLSTSERGRGRILRTNAWGKTANDLNICTNCHINKAAHNASAQNVQCSYCHSGHVAYDPLATTPDEQIPNKYLIRRYMNMTSPTGAFPAVRNVRTFYRYTGATTKELYLGVGGKKGVCQACHYQTAKFSTEHESAPGVLLNDHKVCADCHSHGASSGSFSGGCTSCHGYPPQNTKQGGSTGYGYDATKGLNYATSGVYKNESTAGHPTHAASKPGLYKFACDECHKGNRTVANQHDYAITTNAAASFQYVFKDTAGVVAAGGGSTPFYSTAGNGGRGTCGNMYCHSNGIARPGKTPIAYKLVTWGSTRGSIVNSGNNRCVACHNGVVVVGTTAVYNNMSSNMHFRHVSYSITTSGYTGAYYTCDVCHSATVSNNTTITGPTNHANGAADVSFSGMAAGGTWDNATAKCSTVYCHSDGNGNYVANLSWTTNKAGGACNSCHSTQGAGVTLQSGAHFAHLSSVYGPKLDKNAVPTSCQTCHSYSSETRHVSGAVDVLASPCATCHPSYSAGPYGAVWSTVVGGRLACNSCHDGTLSVINSIAAPRVVQATFATAGHGQFNSYTCTSCHNSSSSHINGGLGDNRLNSSLSSGGFNNQCYFCHNNATTVPTVAFRGMSSHLTPTSTYAGGGASNYSTRSLCSACHTPHGSSNLHMVSGFIDMGTIAVFGRLTATVSFTTDTNRTDFVQFTPPYRGLCQACHTRTAIFKRNAAVTDPVHYGGNCLDCHVHKGGSYAFQPSGGGCNGCHGYPPRKPGFIGSTGYYADASKDEDYVGGGGAHTVPAHVKQTAVQSEGWANCTPCHPNAGAHAKGGTPPKRAFVNITTPDGYRFNSTKPTSYTGDHSTTVGSCNNVSCHFKTTPLWNRP